MRTSLFALLITALAATISFVDLLTPTETWAAASKPTDETRTQTKKRRGNRVSKKATKAKTETRQRRLGTDFNFSDAHVRGKYHSAGEGLVTVEDEKALVDLLGVRRHFKDRLKADTTRN